MAYTTSFSIAVGTTGLTLLASLVDSTGTLHATLRNLACTEIGTSGTYRVSSALMPDGYRGHAVFHTGTLTTIADLTTANTYAIASINPEELENTDVKTSSILSGTGANAITVTVNDGATALENAIVRVTDGVTPIVLTTNVSGQATFSLNNGTYTVSITKAGYSFTPTTRTVTGNQAGTLVTALSMILVVLPTSADPLYATVSGTFKRPNGTSGAGLIITATLYATGPSTNSGGQGIVLEEVKITLDATGAIPAATNLLRTDEVTRIGCVWAFRCNELRLNASGISITAASYNLAALLDA